MHILHPSFRKKCGVGWRWEARKGWSEQRERHKQLCGWQVCMIKCILSSFLNWILNKFYYFSSLFFLSPLLGRFLKTIDMSGLRWSGRLPPMPELKKVEKSCEWALTLKDNLPTSETFVCLYMSACSRASVRKDGYYWQATNTCLRVRLFLLSTGITHFIYDSDTML